MATEQELLTAIEAETDAGMAVVKLLDKIHSELVEARNDPAKLDEVLAKISANKDTWTQAALRNTHSG